ncbi:glycosyltransferase family 9 protein [Flavobacterium sp. UBA7663]|uniref:glycosyltransferase family 9 protein n=1 Tax=Flavobacterium sp. UBA7663 TaxID=1946557 RepID=UPI0025C1F34E|nr:glycosyltransferase family 9 protein [Flavobacterium sp. UBA7663]
MRVPDNVNKLRRTIMRKLTSSFGESNMNGFKLNDYSNREIKILIIRPNHRLGNLLLVTPLIKEIENTFSNPSIDLFVKGNLSEVIFKNYNAVNKHIKLPKKPFDNLFKYFEVWIKLLFNKYDLIINVDEFSSSGRIATKLARSKFKIIGQSEDLKYISKKENEKSKHIAIRPIIIVRRFLGTNLINENEYPLLDVRLDEMEKENGKKKLKEIFNNDNKVITIFTFATGDKMLPQLWWNQFYELLKINFPMYNILEVLPIENISQINFKAKTFYSKDIREIAALIANTSIFIGADSGIMHLSSSSKTTTIGVLSGSFKTKYEPYGNKSIGFDKNGTSQEEIINEMKKNLFFN